MNVEAFFHNISIILYTLCILASLLMVDVRRTCTVFPYHSPLPLLVIFPIKMETTPTALYDVLRLV